MAQTIKFVYESGKVRLTHTAVDLTKSGIRDLQHDYANGNDTVKYFDLTDGQFAPEPVKKARYITHKHR